MQQGVRMQLMLRWLTLLLLLAVSGVASAAPESRRFPIVIQSPAPPDVVCVFGRRKSQLSIPYSLIRKQVFPQSEAKGWVYESGDFSKLVPDWQQSAVSQQQWSYLLESQRKLLEQVHARLAALKAPKDSTNLACNDSPPDCRPQSAAEINDSNWSSVWCARSGDEGNEVSKVAFVGFDFHERAEQEPTFSHVHYDGRVLSVEFTGSAWHGQSIFSIKVLGGTYQLSEPKLGTQTGTTLEIIPWCTTRAVNLPRLWRGEDEQEGLRTPKGAEAEIQLKQEARSAGALACHANVDVAGQFEMTLPIPAKDGLETSLKVSIGKMAAQFGQSWRERLPPASLRPKALKVRFSWQVPCTFDASKGCPRAEFPEQGVHCDATFDEEANVCKYDGCYLAPSAQSDATTSWVDAVSLPAPLLLKSQDRLYTWPDTLVAIDQELSSFVSPDAFQVELDASQWNDQAVGDNVAGWFVTTPDGASRWVPRAEVRDGEKAPSSYAVAVPRLRCTDNLMVRAAGQRRYEERPLKVGSGKVDLGHASDTGHRFSFGMELGGSVLFPFAESGISSRGARSGASGFPGGMLGGWIAYRPRARGWVELSGGYWLSEWQAYGVHGEQSAWYYRLPFMLGGGLQVTDRFGVGVSAGYMRGHPLNHERESLLGDGDSSFVFQGLLRFKASFVPIALDLRLLGSVGEAVQAYDTDFRGGVLHQTGWVASLAPGLFLRWDIVSGTLWPVPVQEAPAKAQAKGHP
jgi:hypothetical protein